MAGDHAEATLDLATALQWMLARNPDLVTLRRSLCVSSAAVAVAKQFPTSLNPTVTVNYEPWTFDRDTGQGAERLEQLLPSPGASRLNLVTARRSGWPSPKPRTTRRIGTSCRRSC